MDMPVQGLDVGASPWDADCDDFGPNPFAVDDQCSFWPALQRTLDFLRIELGHSADLLASLAARLSVEFCGLVEPEAEDDRHARLVRIHEALQTEDRIQQRLRDLSGVIAALELALAPAASRDDRELDIVIGRKLRLEELRSAFSGKGSIGSTGHRPATVSAGDV